MCVCWSVWHCCEFLIVPIARADRSRTANLGCCVNGRWPRVPHGLYEMDFFGPRCSFVGAVRMCLPSAAFSTFWLWMQPRRLPALGGRFGFYPRMWGAHTATKKRLLFKLTNSEDWRCIQMPQLCLFQISLSMTKNFSWWREMTRKAFLFPLT